MVVSKFIKLHVKQEDVERFDQLYHILLRQNLTSEANYPKELKALTTLDVSVVNFVASNPDVIIREIAQQLKIPNSTLTSSLNRLESKGIANRVISTRDRRSFALELTDKGWKVQQVHLDFEQTFFKGILAKLDTHEERTTLLDLMGKIVNAYQVDENSVKKVK